jgi:hypothetical protein
MPLLQNLRAPKSLPTWAQLMEDLGRPTPAELSKHLGLSIRSIYGYNRSGEAPRSVLLALFWESSWGRSTAECDLFNEVRTLKSLSDSLGRENNNLRARVARLEEIGGYGSANAPTLDPERATSAQDAQRAHLAERARVQPHAAPALRVR